MSTFQFLQSFVFILCIPDDVYMAAIDYLDAFVPWRQYDYLPVLLVELN